MIEELIVIKFVQSPYEADILENAVIGSTVIPEILIEDRDSLGETLEVGCIASAQVCLSYNFIEYITEMLIMKRIHCSGQKHAESLKLSLYNHHKAISKVPLSSNRL